MPDKAKNHLPSHRRGDDAVEAGIDERQRSFLRMVSHEFRTPLNTILGFADILSKELYGPLGSPRYLGYAELIVESGQRLLSLANQVIEIAKLEGRTADIQISLQSLDHALDDVTDRLRDEIAAARIDLVIENHGRLSSVRADDQGLRTVLANLIQNVCNHCPEGTQVVISATRAQDNVVISVADRGPGIGPSDFERVMRPFEQGGSALTRRNQGAGLGLRIVTLLCQAMEGRVEMGPTTGGGLTVSVYLPIA